VTQDKTHFYSTIAAEFDSLMNPYDVRRRVELVFDELLTEPLHGKRLLDAGCGSGWFSRAAVERGAVVTSLDLGVPLLLETRKKAAVKAVVGDALRMPFPDASFDVVVSSEMIEHTPDPAQAVAEMARVLRSGGTLVVTCPNKAWQGVVRAASRLRMRPFQGIENFPSFGELDDHVRSTGLQLQRHVGLHAWPFQLKPLWGASEWVDHKFGDRAWKRWMINQAVKAVKP
jgi:ubiquinone/menaquinone biosynthesis C-methylase UbiE